MKLFLLIWVRNNLYDKNQLKEIIMAPAYLIVDTKIREPESYEDYKKLAKPIVESFGGEYLARGGELHIDQDDLWSPSRIVLVKFPSLEQAKSFLNSEQYQSAKALRLNSSRATLTVIEGIE